MFPTPLNVVQGVVLTLKPVNEILKILRQYLWLTVISPPRNLLANT